MNSCEFVTFISILACNIAKDKTASSDSSSEEDSDDEV